MRNVRVRLVFVDPKALISASLAVEKKVAH
jgi:hypothetical protein